MSLLRAILVSVAAATSALATASHGAPHTLRVMPVRVEVAAGKRMCSLTIANDSSEPVSIQVRGYGWSMDDRGRESLDEASGPIVNPGIFTIAKGQSQLVRCSLPPASPGAPEGSWRLIIDELPGAAAPQPGTIRSVLRVSIPVFRAPAEARPALTLNLDPQDKGAPALSLRNTGSRHLRIAALDYPGAEPARSGAALPGFGYLLAGAAWSLPVGASGQSIPAAVTVRTEDGQVQTVSIAPAAAARP